MKGILSVIALFIGLCAISVTPKGDDWYHYKFNDGGTKGAHDIKVINQNGKLMIDGLKRFQSTK